MYYVYIRVVILGVLSRHSSVYCVFTNALLSGFSLLFISILPFYNKFCFLATDRSKITYA